MRSSSHRSRCSARSPLHSYSLLWVFSCFCFNSAVNFAIVQVDPFYTCYITQNPGCSRTRPLTFPAQPRQMKVGDSVYVIRGQLKPSLHYRIKSVVSHTVWLYDPVRGDRVRGVRDSLPRCARRGVRDSLPPPATRAACPAPRHPRPAREGSMWHSLLPPRGTVSCLHVAL